MAWWLLLACSEREKDSAVEVEPLVLPADLAQAGAPVGVRTLEAEGTTFEVWYPAGDRTDGPLDQVDFAAFVPDSVAALLGDLALPRLPTPAVRDAPLRETGEALPVLIFSHGFGGMRVQSFTLTAHLASRGYVVLAADHAGRSAPDLLPCLFTPPAEGCALAPTDPAPPQVMTLLRWIDDPPAPFRGKLDPGRLGLFGHSAGASTTTTPGESEARFGALLPMAGGAAVARDVPTVYLAGACDSTVPAASTQAEAAAAGKPYVELAGGGHLAFADLCALDLAALTGPLAERPDINPTFLTLVEDLATDGCPGAVPRVEGCDAYVDPALTAAAVKHVLTAHFDAALLGASTDLLGGYAELRRED